MRLSLAFAAIVTLIAAAAAGDGIRSEPVTFKAGENSTIIEGHLKGGETVDYVLTADKGQPLNISLTSKSAWVNFNILAPGKADEAFFIGSIAGSQYEGTAPESGEFKVRVYQMRSAARRGEQADYRLEIIRDDGQ